ncbi:hypothetical protein [Streptomyces sp. NBC_00687]|uniref:hypothetical protein n=1 Tax=Streptomyces sp. NBC_00687 TaxID=2975807 RepID=UPI0022572E42|nr:hypothetical protein [Streptomyces sp. NBC_00687]MCX4919653.1 hypothetical protein [Streptomyces sp. NBC_00687]
MADSTDLRVSSVTGRFPLNTYETVADDTPAARATSFMVTRCAMRKHPFTIAAIPAGSCSQRSFPRSRSATTISCVNDHE